MVSRHYLEDELEQLFKQDNELHIFIANAALDGLWFWDLENPDHEWMSPKFWETLGYDPSTKKHHASEWQTLIDPDDLAMALANFQAHCKDPNHPYDQIVRYQHANGSTVWIRCRGMAIRNSEGKAIRMLGAHTDITSLKNAEQRYIDSLKQIDQLYSETKLALEESEQIFHAMPDAVLQVDSTGQILKTNTKASELFGYSAAEFRTIALEKLVPKGMAASHQKLRCDYFNNPIPKEMAERKTQLLALKKDGSEVAVNIRLSPIKTRYGTHVLAVVRDVTDTLVLKETLSESQSQNRELYEQSVKDNLTDLYNRSYFFQTAKKAFANARTQNLSLSVLMIDIDDFKAINDTFGHQEGDEVLLKVSGIIRMTLRSNDILARYGGEEFIVLMPETRGSEAERVANRILQAINAASPEKDSPLSKLPTVSIGVADNRNTEFDLDMIIAEADKALYKAKHQGKNRVTCA